VRRLDVRRAGDNRRFDERQEEQPISKRNFFSEYGQHKPWGKEQKIE